MSVRHSCIIVSVRGKYSSLEETKLFTLRASRRGDLWLGMTWDAFGINLGDREREAICGLG